MSFDAIVHRLQNIEPFLIEKLDPEGKPQPWMQVTGPAIVAELVINPHQLGEQVDAIAAQIGHWGRLVAQTKRVWEVHERLYRHWRSMQELRLYEELTEDIVDAKGHTKRSRPTLGQIEASYRVLPEYAALQSRVEGAEEAYNSASAIYEAFRSKSFTMNADMYRVPDGSMQRRSI